MSNSIGTSSALQAVIDSPEKYTGVCVVTPNFRELHSAEIPLPQFSMPLVRFIQKSLREKGQGLFNLLATPKTVKEILKEPYEIESAIDDTLVNVLLDPLLLPGGSQVVFDTLSYSAGPLPEQQLDMFPIQKPVWISYGKIYIYIYRSSLSLYLLFCDSFILLFCHVFKQTSGTKDPWSKFYV